MDLSFAVHHRHSLATNSRVGGTGSSVSQTEARTSPIIEFVYFHKAIRAELERLRQDAVEVQKGGEKEIRAFSDRCHFLRTMYVQHSNAEDEIIFTALDKRVKNVAHSYSLEHKEESELFDQMLQLLNFTFKNKESTSIKLRQELISCTEAIQTTLCQHMSKEEEQVFPLLVEHFSFEEQGALVWQFMCSMPVNLMERFLPWLVSSLCRDECRDMVSCLDMIIPREDLIRQVVFSWLNGGSISSQLNDAGKANFRQVSELVSEVGFRIRINDDAVENPATPWTGRALTEWQGGNGVLSSCVGSKISLDLVDGHANIGNDFPIDELLYWHNAIRKELKELAEETRKIQLSACTEPSNLSSLANRLQFLAEVCIFHSVAEDKVVFPTVGRKANHGMSYVSDHKQEELQFDDIRCLLEDVHMVGRNSLVDADIYKRICAQADLIVETVQQHLLDEETKVLPLAREHCSIEEQRALLYQSLCVMPLKLLEKVLPWLVSVLSEQEAKSMLQNMRLAAPVADNALVTLFSGWACKGYKQISVNPGKFKCISFNSTEVWPVKKMNCKRTKSSCCYEAESRGISCSQEVESCITNFEESRKQPRKCNVDQEDELCQIVTIQSKSSDSTCCVPGLGVSSCSLGFGAGSTRCSFHTPLISSRHFGSGLFSLENNTGPAGCGVTAKPIDTIFQFHKAIRKDLEYLDTESTKLTDCDEDFLQQFTGRFRLLWGLYCAHSNAEDEIAFPALEAKEALHNVSHSYTLDHKQEEQLFNDISDVLTNLSHLHAKMHGHLATDTPTGSGLAENGTSNQCQDDLYLKQTLSAKLQGMCKSLHIALDQHVFREELELWPLFDVYFTVEEQDKILGQIIGTTGAEVLQSMLPWVTTALTQMEQSSMMDTWRQATCNTMFDKWLLSWWKGSLSPAPPYPVGEQQEVVESGTAESLQLVADYLLKGTLNKDDQQKRSGSGEVYCNDGTSIACKSPVCQGRYGFLLKEQEIHNSEVSADGQVRICSKKQSISAAEEKALIGNIEDQTGKFKPGWQDIFRMNQSELEAAIRKVSSDASLDPRQKAYLMQNLLTSRWIVAQQQQDVISGCIGYGQMDIPGQCPSYRDIENGIYGCEHYKRNCKLRAACCGMLFTCRFCHNKATDHLMDRQATKEMMCMKCLKIQLAGQYCTTPSCNSFCMSAYYCNICKFFDDENRDIYHCPFCNLCRVGKGLGKDYFHCMTCNACMSRTLTVHICREKGLESNCPICHDFLFTSETPVKALACGHFMHSACFRAYTFSHYTCPICSKSLGDMTVYFGMLDALLAAEQLPVEYRDKYQDILCNDCEQKGTCIFHWLYHKCNKCGSYNTRTI